MLKKTLLATTALVLCASLAYAGQESVVQKGSKALAKAFRGFTVGHAVNGIPVSVITSKRGTPAAHNVAPNFEGAIFSNYSKDANSQFISWYGYTTANESSCGPSSGCSIYWIHSIGEHAFAFTPASTVTSRKVTVPLFSSYYPSGHFEVNIYSSVGGLPGNVIAHSKKFTASDNSLCCTASRTVTISANLTAGTQYFIGVSGICCNAHGAWEMEDIDFSGAAVDYYRTSLTVVTHTSGITHSSHYSSPWHASKSIPATGALMLK